YRSIIDLGDLPLCFFFQAEDGIRDGHVTGVQTCALPISGDDIPLSGPALGHRTGWRRGSLRAAGIEGISQGLRQRYSNREDGGEGPWLVNQYLFGALRAPRTAIRLVTTGTQFAFGAV